MFAIAGLAGLVIYSCVVGPLRNVFDDRSPYINVFLTSPGTAARNVAVFAGFVVSVRAVWTKVPSALAFAGGFGCLLTSSLVNAAYGAWAMDHRTELQERIFDRPLRFAIWEWYFWLDVPQVIAAVGVLMLVDGTVKTLRRVKPEAAG